MPGLPSSVTTTLLSFLAAVATLVVQPPQPAHAAPSEMTAQGLLFDTPYLGSLQPPGALSYEFDHSTEFEGVFGEPFGDKVLVRLQKAEKSGEPDPVYMDVYTGPRQRNLGPFNKNNGNPIIMMFLERDVWQMKTRIGGTPSFFRNTIRKAFRESAEVKATEITFNGARLPAQEVTIRPFHSEADENRFREYRGKIYRFTTADAVPGGFFEIWSGIPKPDADGQFLVEDRLTYKSMEK